MHASTRSSLSNLGIVWNSDATSAYQPHEVDAIVHAATSPSRASESSLELSGRSQGRLSDISDFEWPHGHGSD